MSCGLAQRLFSLERFDARRWPRQLRTAKRPRIPGEHPGHPRTTARRVRPPLPLFGILANQEISAGTSSAPTACGRLKMACTHVFTVSSRQIRRSWNGPPSTRGYIHYCATSVRCSSNNLGWRRSENLSLDDRAMRFGLRETSIPFSARIFSGHTTKYHRIAEAVDRVVIERDFDYLAEPSFEDTLDFQGRGSWRHL